MDIIGLLVMGGFLVAYVLSAILWRRHFFYKILPIVYALIVAVSDNVTIDSFFGFGVIGMGFSFIAWLHNKYIDKVE